MKPTVVGWRVGWSTLLAVATVVMALGVSVSGLFAGTSVCGNGIAEPGERCDPGDGLLDPDFHGRTCQTSGFDSGELICTESCSVDYSGCFCGSGAVPATGQTRCWDTDGVLIDCAGTGQDGDVQAGVATTPRFTDNFDGTVTDNLTGLIWLRAANCFFVETWQAALDEANGLANGACGLSDGSVAGDWRLPNIKEMASLIDYGQSFPSIPSGHPFAGVRSSVYWSSTSQIQPGIDNADASDFDSAWGAFLSIGFVNSFSKNGVFFVWPVRAGP